MDIPKPCPFCGSDFIEENESRVRCVCGARIDSSMFFKPDALEKWNTRPSYDALLSVLRQCVEALEWYADHNTWRNAECDRLNGAGGFFPYGIESCPIADDLGEHTQAALAAAVPYLERREGEG